MALNQSDRSHEMKSSVSKSVIAHKEAFKRGLMEKLKDSVFCCRLSRAPRGNSISSIISFSSDMAFKMGPTDPVSPRTAVRKKKKDGQLWGDENPMVWPSRWL
jgi:hypothetical protein